MARVRVKRTNPGLDIEIDDDLVLGLFTDVAMCKEATKGVHKRIDQLWRTLLGFMVINVALLGVILERLFSRL